MDRECWKQAEHLLPSTYIRQAAEAANKRQNLIRQLIQHKKIPAEGWDDFTIETFLVQLSAMDSNNFPSNCGVGEREARFASAIVARRHFNFAHGMGRSGDLIETQPKAAGSSLAAKLTNYMLKDLFTLTGVQDNVYCLLVPVATSMSLVLSMLTIKTKRPNAQYVIWSRIDQKACFKSIITSGLTPIIIDVIAKDDQLVTDLKMMDAKINEIGADNVVCIMTTTSCFAPRACDSIEEVAKICKNYCIPHVINNAYGLQSRFCMKLIQKSFRKGRVDIFVQSTDKNLMVPVGGTVVAGFDKTLIDNISTMYPGRASGSPMFDTFITLLNLGKNGYESLITKREQMYNYLQKELITLAEKHDEKVLYTPDNPISLGFTLKSLKSEHLTKTGSMLFIKNVSGARVITTLESKTISDYTFQGWGSHCANYGTPYLTCAAAIGITEKDVELFVKRLNKVLNKIKRDENADS